MSIHPTAQVAAGAQLGPDVEIGPWCVIGPDARLDEGVRLVSHVVIDGHTEVGARTIVHPFAVLGSVPQHNGYRGEPTRLVIGSDTTIREHVTMHRGTVQGGGLTRVGQGGLFMVGAHVAHDCLVEDRVTFANNATLGGHVTVGEGAFLGGLSAVHQFTRIGQGAILGGGGVLTRDLIPFGSAWGNHARLAGWNLVGLKRRGFDRARIKRMVGFYRDLFEAEGSFSERLARVPAAHADLDEAAQVLAFIAAGGHRPLCLPEA